MKTVKMVTFDEIFNYAREIGGISWNKCVTLFDECLEYKNVTSIYWGDMLSTLLYNITGEFELSEDGLSDFLKNIRHSEISTFPEDLQATVILLKFMMETPGVTDYIEVDYR